MDQRLSLMEDGESVRRLFEGGALGFEPVGIDEADVEEAEVERITGMITGIGGGIILYAMMLIYGAQMLQSVLEEKQSRVVELVISSLRPWQLMLGKIVGVGAVGLTQVAIWIGCVALLATAGAARAPLRAAGPPKEQARVPDNTCRARAPWRCSSCSSCSATSSTRACSPRWGPCAGTCRRPARHKRRIIILIVVPFVLQMTTIEGGGMPWLDWVALFPFFSPIMMYPRAVMGTVRLGGWWARRWC